MCKACPRTCSPSERNTSMRKRHWSAVAVALLASSAFGCNKQSEAPAPAPAPAKTEEAPKPAAAADESAGPKVVAGPGYMPECFAPWSKDTKYLQWPAKKPPFRIALVNGYVGNAW